MEEEDLCVFTGSMDSELNVQGICPSIIFVVKWTDLLAVMGFLYRVMI